MFRKFKMLNFSIKNIYINHHFMVDKFYFLVFQEDVIEELVRRLSGNIGKKVETNYVANYLLSVQLIQKFKNIKTEIISRAYDQVQDFWWKIIKSFNYWFYLFPSQNPFSILNWTQQMTKKKQSCCASWRKADLT